MEKIADALGHDTAFFLSDSFLVPQNNFFMPEKIAFYAGEPTEKQKEIVEKMVRLIENVDVVGTGIVGNISVLGTRPYDLKSKEIFLSCEEFTDLITKLNGISITL